MNDDDQPELDDDPDRAAILARRQRFIAIALSGLAGVAAIDGCKAAAKPCLNVVSPDDPPPAPVEPEEPVEPVEPDGSTQGEPHPCLSPMPPPDPDPEEPTAKPTPCLNVARDPKP